MSNYSKQYHEKTKQPRVVREHCDPKVVEKVAEELQLYWQAPITFNISSNDGYVNSHKVPYRERGFDYYAMRSDMLNGLPRGLYEAAKRGQITHNDVVLIKRSDVR